MGKVKKAVFFSIVSIFIIILFISMTELISEFSSGETELDITRTKVKVLNSLVKDMENNYFEKIVYVSTKNALIGLSEYYFDNSFSNVNRVLDKTLNNLAYEGILLRTGGTKVNLTEMGYIDPEYTIKGLVENITGTYKRIGMRVNKLRVNITPDSLEQVDPWNIKVSADIVYDFEDTEGIVSWKGVTQRTVIIPVFGIYAFDMENGDKGNLGRITSYWIEDDGPRLTEYSLVDKLSYSNFYGIPSRGICSPDFRYGGENCSADTNI